MNKENIIRLAREAWLSEKEAQLITEFDEAYISCTYLQDLEKFAALVASSEREEIIKIAKDLYYWDDSELLIKAIQARGQA